MAESIESEMTLENFTFYTVPQLKEYVSDRGLTVSGTKEELVARAFVASELHLPLKKSELQVKKDLILEYNKLLSVSDQRMLPDPHKIPENQWVGEEEGIKCWPPIYISDIYDFYKLKNKDNTLDFTSRIINEYKEGKAFRYYADGWLKEVFYHQVPENDYCFLKAKCTPSQKIRDPPHSLWVCATAHGEIHSAYCSCTAGCIQTCNHVWGLLFRTEAAVRMGLTNPATTSETCRWNVPFSKTLEPQPLSRIVFKKEKYGKIKERPLVDAKKKLFEPLNARHDSTEMEMRKTLCQSLYQAVPNAVLFTAYQMEDEQLVTGQATSVIPTPVPIFELAKPFTILSDNPSEHLITDHVKLFIENLPEYNDQEISSLAKATVGQSESKEWHAHRQGRITASNFYDVHTKMLTLQNSDSHRSKGVDSLVKRVMGYTKPNPNLKSFKYGRAMEPHAINFYISMMKKSHKGFSYQHDWNYFGIIGFATKYKKCFNQFKMTC